MQDVRTCVEQLQAIEKEVQALEDAKKSLTELKDQLSEKRGEQSDLLRKSEVLVLYHPCFTARPYPR